MHTVRYDARVVRPNLTFFQVFWLPADGILIRWAALFGEQIGSTKREHSTTAQNAQREKRMPNLRIPLGPASKGLNIADKCLTMFASSQNCAKVGGFTKLLQKTSFFEWKNRLKILPPRRYGRFFEGAPNPQNDDQNDARASHFGSQNPFYIRGIHFAMFLFKNRFP